MTKQAKANRSVSPGALISSRRAVPRVSTMRIPTRAGGVLGAMLIGILTAACTLSPKDEAPTVQGVTSNEAAAMAEYAALGDAMARTGRAPRLRYVSILEKYPGTRTAYEANLDLAQQDFAAIEMQKSTSRTNEPVARSSKEFLDFFAYGPHADPPMPDLQARYRAEMQPLYFKAIKHVGTWQSTLEYFAAYPDSPYAAEIESSTESALLSGNAGWEAPEILKVYQEIRPERVREQKLAAKVETQLFRRLNSGTSVETLNRFIKTFPGSIYADTVESMIDRLLDRKITLFLDRPELEKIIREKAGTVDAAQAQEVLAQLAAQEAVYQQAASTNRVSTLEAFMAANPESRFLTRAARRIEELKLQALPAAQQSSLRAYRDQMSSVSPVSSGASAHETRLQNLRNEYETAQKQARDTQTKRYDLEAEAREHRRMVKFLDGQIKKIKGAMKRDPSLKAELEKRQKERAEHQADAKRLDGEAAEMAKVAEELKTRAVELEEQVNATRLDARSSEVDVLDQKNEIRHEYLARLNAAWEASGRAS